jgi:uncharacterized SAM-binding protein YcdF (DUF218 family)
MKLADAIVRLRNCKHSLLVISGGVTRCGQVSEADGAYELVPVDLRPWVLLEKRSLSTRQNVLYTKALLKSQDVPVDDIIVLSLPVHERSVRFLFKQIWPEVLPRFRFQPIGTDPWWKWVEYAIYDVIRFIDREERFFLPLKKKFIMKA